MSDAMRDGSPGAPWSLAEVERAIRRSRRVLVVGDPRADAVRAEGRESLLRRAALIGDDGLAAEYLARRAAADPLGQA